MSCHDRTIPNILLHNFLSLPAVTDLALPSIHVNSLTVSTFCTFCCMLKTKKIEQVRTLREKIFLQENIFVEYSKINFYTFRTFFNKSVQFVLTKKS